MSCWTANRRGVKLVSEVIKRRHPNAHVAVGGPHATPLGTELLRNYTNVDTVCLGESDVTFLEIVDRQKGRLSPWGCSSSPMARACLSAIFRGPRLGLAGRRWGSYAPTAPGTRRGMNFMERLYTRRASESTPNGTVGACACVPSRCRIWTRCAESCPHCWRRAVSWSRGRSLESSTVRSRHCP